MVRGSGGRHRAFGDLAFSGGSVVAALAHGITLGALLQGITVKGRSYGGGWWDWLISFSLLASVSLEIRCGLLGAFWLVMRTEGDLQARVRRYALRLAIGNVVCIGLLSAATPFLEGKYCQRWFDWPSILLTAQVALLVAIAAALFFVSLRRGAEATPFVLALGLFQLSFIGIGISIYPDIVPGRIMIWQAALPRSSQLFMLAGAKS